MIFMFLVCTPDAPEAIRSASATVMLETVPLDNDTDESAEDGQSIVAVPSAEGDRYKRH